MRYWWVSQSSSWRTAIPEGTLWAGPSASGRRVPGREALKRLQVGDVVVHYGAGAVRAVSQVIEAWTPASRPPGYRKRRPQEPDDGWLVRVRPGRTGLRLPRQVAAGLVAPGAPGPFDSDGAPGRRYVSELTDDDAALLLAALGEHDDDDAARAHPMFTSRCHDVRMTVDEVRDSGQDSRVEDVLAELEQEPLREDRFADRELSWLRFNERVLELAEDPDLPLLERARFLAIFASNLDEFFMVRVAGLKRRIATGMAVTAASGLTPRQVLEQISLTAHELTARHARVFTDVVQPALHGEGITLVHFDALSESEKERLHKYFRRMIFPVLTPLAVDPAHPFPYISGLSLNLGVIVRNPGTGKEHFARVKVPPLLPRFIAVDGRGKPRLPDDVTAEMATEASFVPIEDVIASFLYYLFPGMDVVEHHVFRVTRNEDLEVEEDDAENLLKALEKELLRRRFGPPVRLELAEGFMPKLREMLIRELSIGEQDVYELPPPLDLTGLNLIADLDRAELSYPRFVPTTNRALAEVESANPTDIFAAIRAGDVLLHHPYDSFSTSVQQFLEQAAADPRVLAIKQTLYRTSGDSPIVDALIGAAEAGKQVLAIVEIKARFDEQANIEWARKLEQAGVHVVYGIVGLKTHCKLSLVVRQETEGLRRYCHVGTGNYNPKTARLYEDHGLLTCDPEVGQDLTRLFNQLSGYAPKSRFHRLLVAPRSIRTGLIERIHREIANHAAGKEAWIKLKMNSVVDEATIDALYRASQAGVPVDAVVRGICAIKAGVPGLSENIRVRSILGRFLEHSRIYAFANDGDPDVLIGSADLMHRNLDRRVEVLVRVTDADHIAELVGLIDASVAPTTASWHLENDPERGQQWRRVHLGEDGEPLADLQVLLMSAHRRTTAASR